MRKEFKPSKILQKLAETDDRVFEYWCDSDGHWIILEDGWYHPGDGSRSILSETVNQAKSELQKIAEDAD